MDVPAGGASSSRQEARTRPGRGGPDEAAQDGGTRGWASENQHGTRTRPLLRGPRGKTGLEPGLLAGRTG